jgi:hypothetical protein
MGDSCNLILLIMFLIFYILAHCGKEYYRASWCPESKYDSKSTAVLDYPAFQLACGKSRNETFVPYEATTFAPLKTPLMLRQHNKKINESFVWQDPQFQNKYSNLIGSTQARKKQKKLNEQFCGACVG